MIEPWPARVPACGSTATTTKSTPAAFSGTPAPFSSANSSANSSAASEVSYKTSTTGSGDSVAAGEHRGRSTSSAAAAAAHARGDSSARSSTSTLLTTPSSSSASGSGGSDAETPGKLKQQRRGGAAGGRQSQAISTMPQQQSDSAPPPPLSALPTASKKGSENGSATASEAAAPVTTAATTTGATTTITTSASSSRASSPRRTATASSSRRSSLRADGLIDDDDGRQVRARATPSTSRSGSRQGRRRSAARQPGRSASSPALSAQAPDSPAKHHAALPGSSVDSNTTRASSEASTATARRAATRSRSRVRRAAGDEGDDERDGRDDDNDDDDDDNAALSMKVKPPPVIHETPAGRGRALSSASDDLKRDDAKRRDDTLSPGRDTSTSSMFEGIEHIIRHQIRQPTRTTKSTSLDTLLTCGIGDYAYVYEQGSVPDEVEPPRKPRAETKAGNKSEVVGSQNNGLMDPIQRLPDGTRRRAVVLGKGKFSEVILATKGADEAKFAVKHTPLHPHHPLIATRLLRESSILAKLLPHPNLVKVYETIRTPGHFYLIEENLESSTTLDAMVVAQPGGVLPEQMAWAVLDQLASVVQSLHEPLRVCHRDIKPENVLVQRQRADDMDDDEEGELVLKLLDFGLATHYSASEAKLTTCCGSPAYHSPELWRSLREAPGSVRYWGPEIDIWCVGLTVLRCVCGLRYPLGISHTSLQSIHDKTRDALARVRYSGLRRTLQGLLSLDSRERRKAFADLIESRRLQWSYAESDSPKPPPTPASEAGPELSLPQKWQLQRDFKSTSFVQTEVKHSLGLSVYKPPLAGSMRGVTPDSFGMLATPGGHILRSTPSSALPSPSATSSTTPSTPFDVNSPHMRRLSLTTATTAEESSAPPTHVAAPHHSRTHSQSGHPFHPHLHHHSHHLPATSLAPAQVETPAIEATTGLPTMSGNISTPTAAHGAVTARPDNAVTPQPPAPVPLEIILLNPGAEPIRRCTSFIKYALRCAGVIYHARVPPLQRNESDLSSRSAGAVSNSKATEEKTFVAYLECAIELPAPALSASEASLMAALGQAAGNERQPYAARPELMRAQTADPSRRSSSQPPGSYAGGTRSPQRSRAEPAGPRKVDDSPNGGPSRDVKATTFWLSVRAGPRRRVPGFSVPGRQGRSRSGATNKKIDTVVVTISDERAQDIVRDALKRATQGNEPEEPEPMPAPSLPQTVASSDPRLSRTAPSSPRVQPADDARGRRIERRRVPASMDFGFETSRSPAPPPPRTSATTVQPGGLLDYFSLAKWNLRSSSHGGDVTPRSKPSRSQSVQRLDALGKTPM